MLGKEKDLGVEVWNTFHDVNDCIEWLSVFSFLYCLIVQAGELHAMGFLRAKWKMGGCTLFVAAS